MFSNTERVDYSGTDSSGSKQDKPFILQVDASDIGIGGALMQDYDGELRPVAFTSRKLMSRERA